MYIWKAPRAQKRAQENLSRGGGFLAVFQERGVS